MIHDLVFVQSPDAWATLGHVKYMKGDAAAKNCYERTLSFVTDASEMHSIYLRLASMHLLDEEVGCHKTWCKNAFQSAGAAANDIQQRHTRSCSVVLCL